MRSNKLATFTAGTVSYLLAKAGRELVLLPKKRDPRNVYPLHVKFQQDLLLTAKINI